MDISKNNQEHTDYCLRKKSLTIKKTPLETMLRGLNRNETQSFIFSEQFFWVINNAPGLVTFKDHASRFLSCNHKMARLGNLATPEEIIGKYDSELPWGETEVLKSFEEQDQEAMQGFITYVLGSYHFFDKERLLLTKKVPILSKNSQIMGHVNYITEIEKPILAPMVSVLLQNEITITPDLIDILKNVFVASDATQLHFSPREEECLYYLLRGFSMKEIARKLDLTYRTIEFYVDGIKDKLKCRKLPALTAKAMALGCFDIVPAKILLSENILT